MPEVGGATPDALAEVLGKVLASGRLTRMPRNPAHCDILLAIVSLDLRRRYPYSEFEINDVLKRKLGRLRATVDHVTCRRYLVDLGFLKRDRSGSRYFVSPGRIEAVLSSEAAAKAGELLDTVLRAGRGRYERHG